MTAAPLVSVIINNHNYARYLGEAIDSALGQTYRHTEVVVVDDGSSDGSRDVIAAYGARVVPVLKENGGQASAFNAGFAASRGEVVLFLDADDCLLPNAAEAVQPYFRDESVVKVHWKLLGMDAEGNALPVFVPRLDIPEGDLKALTLEAGPNAFVNPPTSGNAWSRRFLARVLPVRENGDRHGADAYLFALAPLYGVIRRVEQPLSRYRVHPGNFSGTPAHQLRRDVRRFDQHCTLLAEHCMALGIDVPVDRWREASWVGRVGSFVRELEGVIPPGAIYLLVDDNQLGTGVLRRRFAMPFLEKDGQYWGPPPDDEVARRELDRMRAMGAGFIAFAWTAFWWLDAYPRLLDSLRATYRCVLESERAVVFDLRAGSESIADAPPAGHVRVTCPFCRSSAGAFLPFGHTHPVLSEQRVVGGGYRANALCPVCGSTDRHRLLYLYLRNETALFEAPATVLHVAPELRLEELLEGLPHLDYVTADLLSPRVKVKMDITAIQYPADTFDCIICNHVLEHVPDDRRAMSELFRVLKPGGWAVLQVPVSLGLDATYEDPTVGTGPERERAFGQADHVRIYSARDYPRRLAESGFRVERFRWTDHPEAFGGPSNPFALNPDEVVFVARKPS